MKAMMICLGQWTLIISSRQRTVVNLWMRIVCKISRKKKRAKAVWRNQDWVKQTYFKKDWYIHDSYIIDMYNSEYSGITKKEAYSRRKMCGFFRVRFVDDPAVTYSLSLWFFFLLTNSFQFVFALFPLLDVIASNILNVVI